MVNSQYKLCSEVLRRLEDARVLSNLVLIGSWCIPCYKEYFKDVYVAAPLRTRDVDFMVVHPRTFAETVDLPELFKDLGFVVGFKGMQGFMRLEHPSLMIEFLVPEKGKGIDTPYPLPKLGMNAQTLRFLDLLMMRTMQVVFEGVPVVVPHPAAYVLHKLIVAQRRREQPKSAKDRRDALMVLDMLMKKGDMVIVQSIFDDIPKNWQKMINKSLADEGQQPLFQYFALKQQRMV